MSFATVEDYKKRYNANCDDARIEVQLEDASNMLTSAYEDYFCTPYQEGEHAHFDDNACAVCCGMVARALSAPDNLFGVSQHSETVGSFTQSVSFRSDSGELYFTKADKRRLGLSGARIGSVHARSALDD